MPANADGSVDVRLAGGRVTVVLGPDPVRRGLLNRLNAPATPAVLTVTSGRARSAGERIAALEQAAGQSPTLVLVNRLTDGLDAADRRAVLVELRNIAATGAAVLVDDADPVAALAVADVALRAGADGSVKIDDLVSTPLYRAS